MNHEDHEDREGRAFDALFVSRSDRQDAVKTLTMAWRQSALPTEMRGGRTNVAVTNNWGTLHRAILDL